MLNEKTQYFDTSKKILNLIPKNGIIAEIGVLRGEFSNQINILCNPKKLYLIDCWEEQDDEKYLLDTYNEGDEQTHEENYINVLKTFINKDNVKIIKAKSDLVLSGSVVFEETVLLLEPQVKIKWLFNEGDYIYIIDEPITNTQNFSKEFPFLRHVDFYIISFE